MPFHRLISGWMRSVQKKCAGQNTGLHKKARCVQHAILISIHSSESCNRIRNEQQLWDYFLLDESTASLWVWLLIAACHDRSGCCASFQGGEKRASGEAAKREQWRCRGRRAKKGLMNLFCGGRAILAILLAERKLRRPSDDLPLSCFLDVSWPL